MSLLVASNLGGCAVYPLPQDAAGAETKDIVANFRCQARRAVRQALIKELQYFQNVQVTSRYKGGELAAELDAGLKDFSKLRVGDFINDARKAFAYYATTMVTYEFTLKMTEENKQGVGIDLIRKFTRRVDTIGLSATEDRMRDVSRVFTLHDTFYNLATGIKHKYCEEKPGIDFIFPSRGRLPVEDLINTYIYVNEWGTLDKAQGPSFEGSPKGPATRQMADTIMFTTSLSSVNNPGIMYNPAGLGFGTSSLSFTNENSRKDLHKVIVTLTTTDVPDGHGDFKATAPLPPDALRKSGEDAIVSIRAKNAQDDLSTIAQSLSRGTGLGLGLGF